MYHRAVVGSHVMMTIFKGLVSVKGWSLKTQKESHWERNAYLSCCVFPLEVQMEEQSASRPRMYFPVSQEQGNPVLPQRQGPQWTALLEPLAQQNEQISLVIQAMPAWQADDCCLLLTCICNIHVNVITFSCPVIYCFWWHAANGNEFYSVMIKDVIWREAGVGDRDDIVLLASWAN